MYYCLAFVITENVPDVKSAIDNLMKEYSAKYTIGRILYKKSKMAIYLNKDINEWKEALKNATMYDITRCERKINELSKMTPEEYWQSISSNRKEDDFDIFGNIITRRNKYDKYSSYKIGGQWENLLSKTTVPVSEVIDKQYPWIILTPNCLWYDHKNINKNKWHNIVDRIYKKYNSDKYVLTVVEVLTHYDY